MKYYGPRPWLKKLRESKNMTQFEIACAAGCTPEYYQKIEYGTKNPSLELAIAIAKLLEFPVERFTQQHGEMNESVQPPAPAVS